MCWVIGQLLGTGILRSLVHNDSEWSYRLPFALQWAFAVPLLIGIAFAPESPCKLPSMFIPYSKLTHSRRVAHPS